MTTTTKLADYNNGNVSVALYSDGTKIRTYIGDPRPEHPESIDLKITNWCDGGCSFCHESAIPTGRDADEAVIFRMIDGLPAGVELAIGGGDPLSHPRILTILQGVAKRGLIANATVSGTHIYQHYDLIRYLRHVKLIYGLGVSYNEQIWSDYAQRSNSFERFGRCLSISDVVDDNTIIHFIAGEHSPLEALCMSMQHPKILVLGYKRYGRGVQAWGPRIERMLGAWRYWIGTMMHRATVCFDNLAIEQLRIKERVTAEEWDKYYMGADGSFTIYADAVLDEYAVSSTSPKSPAMGRTAREYFKDIAA